LSSDSLRHAVDTVEVGPHNSITATAVCRLEIGPVKVVRAHRLRYLLRRVTFNFSGAEFRRQQIR